MFSRLSPSLVTFGASVVLVAGLIGALFWINQPVHKPLEIYCAAAMRAVVAAIAREYEAEYGQQVVIHAGASQAILVRMEEAKSGDLFLPADDSYIALAEKKQLVSDVTNLARMQAVVIVRPGLTREIKNWDDVLAAGSNMGLANPDATAIGKLTRRELQAQGLWDGVEARKPSYLGDVNEVGNSVAKLGSSDVGITWDPLAQALLQKNPGVKIVHLKELAPVKAHVKIAVVKATAQRDLALRFIAFLCATDKGAVHLKKAGYADVDEAKEVEK